MKQLQMTSVALAGVVIFVVITFIRSYIGTQNMKLGSIEDNALKEQRRGDFFPRPEAFLHKTKDTMMNKSIGIGKEAFLKSRLRLIDSSFLFCQTPKTGCTAWNNFFYYLDKGTLITANMTRNNAGRVYTESIKDRKKNGKPSNPLENLTIQEISNFDRIVVARNPYVRFLSSYQDWLARHKKEGADVSFSNFTELYERDGLKGFGGNLMNHIDPITKNCDFEGIGGYIVLRVEEEALWFNEFVDHYNLTQKMTEYLKGGNRVFQSLLDESSRVADLVLSIVGTQPYPSVLYESKHHRGSSNKLAQYYTPELAAKVTQLFMSDFIHFQYPLWDGNPVTFHFI